MTLPPFFTTSILVAIFLGIVVGYVVGSIDRYDIMHDFIINLLWSTGEIFLSLLRMLIIPVIFVSLITGIASMPGTYKLGAISTLTIALYLATTTMAVSLAIVAANFFQIGTGLSLQPVAKNIASATPPDFYATLQAFFPSNIIAAMADGNMIQVLVFAGLLGVAILHSGKAGTRFSKAMNDLHEVLITLVLLVMRFAPIGVFALTASVVIQHGFVFVSAVGGYFFTVIGVLALQVVVVYGLMLGVYGKISIFKFLGKISTALIFAFGVSSSIASIPVVLAIVKERLHVSEGTASFVIPLGATMNMDGTAIMQGVATVFLSHIYGIDLSIDQYTMVVLLAVFSSVGTAGIPGAGLLTLSLVLHEVGVPLEGIAIILGVDRLLDMLRTAVNITGDCTIAMLVDKRVAHYQKSTHRKAATTSL